jgi:hypothetical protein
METKTYHLECSGLDEDLKFEYDPEDEWALILSHNIMSFYSLQNPIRKRFERMFQMIWCALTGKEYRFFEIVIMKEDFQKFKDWVAEL